MTGIKYDGDKPEMYLLPPLSMVEVAKVLTYGAKKYSPDNWRKVEGLQERYTSAALRHLFSDMAGERADAETEISHLAHAICCLLFKLEDRLMAEAETQDLMGRVLFNELMEGMDEIAETQKLEEDAEIQTQNNLARRSVKESYNDYVSWQEQQWNKMFRPRGVVKWGKGE